MSAGHRDWKTLRSAVRIPALLKALGLLSQFRRVGASLRGPCPIHHGDNRTALCIHLDQNLWFCHTRCGGGNVIDLAFHLSGQSWSRTLPLLDRLADNSRRHDVGAHTSGLSRSPPLVHTSKERIFRPFTHELPLDPAHPFFESRGLLPETLRTFEAGIWWGRGFLLGCAGVRLHDLKGRPVGYMGRRLDPDDVRSYGKWTWPPGYPKGRWLYGWHRLPPGAKPTLILVESPWSVMKFYQAGIRNVVALGGTVITGHHRGLLEDVQELILFLDGDITGIQAAKRHKMAQVHPNLTILPCPANLDPADLSEPQLRQLPSR